MAWTTRVKASDGAALLLFYDGPGDPRECRSLRFVNPRTQKIEALRQDAAYPFEWARIDVGDCPEEATRVALRW